MLILIVFLKLGPPDRGRDALRSHDAFSWELPFRVIVKTPQPKCHFASQERRKTFEFCSDRKCSRSDFRRPNETAHVLFLRRDFALN